MKYKITLTRTANGEQEYLQIMADDSFSTNIVLIGEFELNDARPKPEPRESGPIPSKRSKKR